jgi:hypothetical protein
MCINMHDGSNINNTSFEQFDLDIKYKLAINIKNSLNNYISWGWPHMVYLIWLVHPKDYDIGKRPRILLSNYLLFEQGSRIDLL